MNHIGTSFSRSEASEPNISNIPKEIIKMTDKKIRQRKFLVTQYNYYLNFHGKDYRLTKHYRSQIKKFDNENK